MLSLFAFFGITEPVLQCPNSHQKLHKSQCAPTLTPCTCHITTTSNFIHPLSQFSFWLLLSWTVSCSCQENPALFSVISWLTKNLKFMYAFKKLTFLYFRKHAAGTTVTSDAAPFLSGCLQSTLQLFPFDSDVTKQNSVNPNTPNTDGHTFLLCHFNPRCYRCLYGSLRKFTLCKTFVQMLL